MTPQTNHPFLLEVKNVSKQFGVVRALDSVDFNVKENEIHSICGENGAGKSTLVNILSGVYPYGDYEGNIYFLGDQCKFRNIRDSERLHIAIIHQQLALIPELSIAENIFIGHEISKNGIIDWMETNQKAKEIMETVGLHENPEMKVKELGVGKQQLVEICKAVSKSVRLLILDEPTAALNDEESERLLELLLRFKRQGISAILISHKINELIKVSDRITIIRDGQLIETLEVGKDAVTEDRVIKGMVGREMTNRFPKWDLSIGETLFEIKDWNVLDPINDMRKKIKNVSLYVREGEVLGLAGLMGSGRTELAMSVFGRSYGAGITGSLYRRGKKIECRNVPEAIANNIGYVSEDRHRYGYIPKQSVKYNVTLPNLSKFRKRLSIDERREYEVTNAYVKKLKIKAYSVEQPINSLSGGNQQKVIFSKWALADSSVLILDEPTRGIDVGAKYEIYELINEMVKQHSAIILISSDMAELIGLCDRVYVMSEGRLVGELTAPYITQESIMQYILRNEELAN